MGGIERLDRDARTDRWRIPDVRRRDADAP
jgi:hypothetical protein